MGTTANRSPSRKHRQRRSPFSLPSTLWDRGFRQLVFALLPRVLESCQLPLSKKIFYWRKWPKSEATCSDGGGRTSLTECTQQHIPGTSRSRSHFLSCTVCGAVRFLCRASPCCSAMHLATQCLACCSVREDYTLGSGCSCTYQDPRLFRLVQSVYFITPVVAGVWIMGQVTEGGAWHQGAAGDFHSVFARCRPHKLP